ncbi:MAG: CRISPR-associated endonuclease Cas1 [Candidatus Micrarchaeia archaeon]
MILEITEHGSSLARKNESFVITHGGEKKEIPAVKLDAIVISCNAAISTAAIRLCLEKSIQLVIADGTGMPLGRFWHSTLGKHTELRRRQYLAQETPLANRIARRILEAKLREQKRLLSDLKNNRSAATPELSAALSVLEQTLTTLERTPSLTKQAMLGLEGNASSAYLAAIASLLPPFYRFQTRSQHPARDPFNALLNYAYGIGYREVESVAIISGLDPNAGFYHSDQYNKPTLSFDLIELFRPKIDRLCISLVTKRLAREKWFTSSDGTWSLTQEGRRAVIAAYYDRIHRPIASECWAFCRWIIEELMGNAD